MKGNEINIFAEERRNNIFDLLQKNKRATIVELSEHFNVGPATIRRDLAKMEQSGLIRRTHGGAIEKESAYDEVSLDIRVNQNQSEKSGIAKIASRFVSNGDILMIDGGSTTQMVAKNLKTKKKLMVLTNSAAIAYTLLGINNNTVMMTGGEVNAETGVMLGPIATNAISLHRADRAILGMSSIFCNEGLFTVNTYEAELKRKMIESCTDVTVVADSTKFDRRSFSFVCNFTKINRIITDKGIDEKSLATLTKNGVDVIYE